MREREPAEPALPPPVLGRLITDYLATLSREATKQYLLKTPIDLSDD